MDIVFFSLQIGFGPQPKWHLTTTLNVYVVFCPWKTTIYHYL